MRVIDLALKDLKQLAQERRTIFNLLVMPVGFTLLLGFMFGGFNAGNSDPRLPLALVNDDNSLAEAWLLAFLDNSDVIRLVEAEGTSIDRLRQQVADEEYAGLLVIPPGFGQNLLQGSRPQLDLVITPGGLNSESIKQEISGAVARLKSAALVAQLSVEAHEQQQVFADASARQSALEASFESALSEWETPPVRVKITKPGTRIDATEGGLDYDNAFVHSSPGMMMQLAIAGLMGAAEIIVGERRSRSLQRLLTTAISRPGILLGHYLAMFTMLFVQFSVLILFGQAFLRLNYLQAPLATLLIAVTVAMCVAALGLLIGALAKSRENAVVFSLIPMFVLSGIGGAWVPLEFTSDTVQLVGHISPVAWGMDGFKNILARGLGFEAALLPAGMLLLFAALFFALAAWRFRFE